MLYKCWVLKNNNNINNNNYYYCYYSEPNNKNAYTPEKHCKSFVNVAVDVIILNNYYVI